MKIASNLAYRLARFGAHVLIVDSLAPSFGGNRFNLNGIEDAVQFVIGNLRDPALAAEAIWR